MSLDAQPIALTKRGRIVIEADGSILVSDFEGERTTCRETCVLALGWAIQHLAAEMMKDIERPGGSKLVGDATVPEWASERIPSAKRIDRSMSDALRLARREIVALTTACGTGLLTEPTLAAIDAALGGCGQTSATAGSTEN